METVRFEIRGITALEVGAKRGWGGWLTGLVRILR
jgi:hypothetical protein